MSLEGAHPLELTIEVLILPSLILSFLRAPWHPTGYKCGCVGSKIGAHVCAWFLGGEPRLVGLEEGLTSC